MLSFPFSFAFDFGVVALVELVQGKEEIPTLHSHPNTIQTTDSEQLQKEDEGWQ